jgi:crotonobetainyl-CoA:carnitine CoA-transferase CaiB-like acyl-CoA transferase
VAHFQTSVRDEFVRKLRAAGVFCGPVLSYSELVDEPHVWVNGYLAHVDHPKYGRKQTFGQPVVFHSTPAPAPGMSPRLGEHTDEVLREIGARLAPSRL